MHVRKVSLTLPSDLLDEARRLAPNGNLSAYVADGLRRRVLSDRLGRYLRELDAECGPLTDEEIAAARREWPSED
jgi:post-segregation antitoxin CcdA